MWLFVAVRFAKKRNKVDPYEHACMCPELYVNMKGYREISLKLLNLHYNNSALQIN